MPHSKDDLITELEAAVHAPIIHERTDLEPFARDFSGLHIAFPRAVVCAANEEDLADTFRVAARCGSRVVLRGAGHSSNGQTLAKDGVVLRNFGPGGDMNLDASTGLVSVAARTSWMDLQEYLVSKGRACAVLTDFLELSVGGTLSAGGYGARSIANGAQIDNVERLRLVLPNGRCLWCSPTENFDLFRLALAGQGAVGAIERAVLRTIPHRQRTRIYGFDLAGLGGLANSLGWLEDWTGPTPDWFVGAQRFRPGPAFTVAQYGFDFDPERPLEAFPLTPLAARPLSWVQVHDRVEQRAHDRTVDLVEGHPKCVRLWADYMFGYGSFVRFSEHVEQLLDTSSLRQHLTVIGVLIHRSPPGKHAFPFEASSPALGKFKYMLGFYFFVPVEQTEDIAAVRSLLGDLLARCVDWGGRPYRYGVSDLDDAQRHALLEPAASDVARVLSQYGVS